MPALNILVPSLSFAFTESPALITTSAFNPLLESQDVNIILDVSLNVLNNLFCFATDISGNYTLPIAPSSVSNGVIPPVYNVCSNDDASFNNVLPSALSAYARGLTTDPSYGSPYALPTGTLALSSELLSYIYTYLISNSATGVAANGGTTVTPINPITSFTSISNDVAVKDGIVTSVNDKFAEKLRSFGTNFIAYSTDNSGNSTGNSPTATPTTMILQYISANDSTRLNTAPTVITTADASGNVSFTLGTGSITKNIGAGKAVYQNYLQANDTVNFIATANMANNYKPTQSGSAIIPSRKYKIALKCV